MSEHVVHEVIENKIYLIRGKRVILDRDLAKLYGVTTGRLNEAVKRKIKRFPAGYMFVLTPQELTTWISQIAISNKKKKGLRKPPLAFTEHGVAMLSSVLNSERAIQVNLQIVDAFIKIREMLSSHVELRHKIEELEKKYDHQFKIIFDVIKQLIKEEEQPKRQIGFHAPQLEENRG